MVYVTRRFEFSASRRYWRTEWSDEHNQQIFGTHTSPYGHGYNYTLDVTIAGSADPHTGMVINITDMKTIVGAVVDEFDHAFLNADTPYFTDMLPTPENIVRVLWHLIADRLPASTPLARLRLYETDDLWAEYSGQEEASLTRVYRFSAAHRLHVPSLSDEQNRQLFGTASNVSGHGHNYTLEVTIQDRIDDQTGTVTDPAQTAAIRAVVEEFHHTFLNIDTPYFTEMVATTENIVRVLWRVLTDRLPAGTPLARLRLHETDDLWAEYSGQEESSFARIYTFFAAHRLHAPALSDEQNRQIYGKCNNPNGHGHTYTLEVAVQGAVDDQTGTVINLLQMDHLVRSLLDGLEHCHLDNEVAAFASMPSTGENIIVYLWNELAPRFDSHRAHLKLWETRKNSFEYRGVR